MTMTFTRKDIGAELARRLIDAALSRAKSLEIAVAAAVVDSGGNLVALERMDGAQIVAAPLAIDKAWSAVACGAPTGAWATPTQPGGPDWGFNTALAGRVVVMPGGLPVFVDGELIGAIGVSGGEGVQDLDCAETAGEAAFQSEPPEPRGG
jgi:uncharacterized protein GlcG (DUF336 family)